MLSGEEAVYDVADRLVMAAYLKLATVPAGAPERYGVVPGAIAWDNCDCGQLAATIGQIYLTDNFPTEKTAVTGACYVAFRAADITIQVVRCVPGPTDDGQPPAMADLGAAALTAAIDGYQMHLGVACKLQDMKTAEDIEDYLIRPMTPLGPSGLCGGSELRVTVCLPRG